MEELNDGLEGEERAASLQTIFVCAPDYKFFKHLPQDNTKEEESILLPGYLLQEVKDRRLPS